MELHMEYYLVISTIMLFAGIYGFITRRNLLAVLISIELILNSVDINFAVFNRYLFPEQLEGFFFTLFAIGVSACETAVAIAIIINIYRNIRNIQVKNLNELKEEEQRNGQLKIENEKTTTPSDSPLHRGRGERENAPRCNNAACPPPCQGGVRGGSI